MSWLRRQLTPNRPRGNVMLVYVNQYGQDHRAIRYHGSNQLGR